MTLPSRTPRSPRFSRRFPVEFGTAPTLSHGGFTANVSVRGMRVQSPFLHLIGEALDFRVRLPDGRVSEVTGRVVWAREGTAKLSIPHEMGIVVLVSDAAWVQAVEEPTPVVVVPVPPRRPSQPTPAAQSIPPHGHAWGVPTTRVSTSTPPAARGPSTGATPPPPLKRAPTLAELKARPHTPRATRYRQVVQVRYGPDERYDSKGQTYDVSITDVSIETLSLQPVGTVLSLEFALHGDVLSKCAGTVVRVRSFGLLQRRPNSMAVRFLHVDDAWRSFIEWRESQGDAVPPHGGGRPVG